MTVFPRQPTLSPCLSFHLPKKQQTSKPLMSSDYMESSLTVGLRYGSLFARVWALALASPEGFIQRLMAKPQGPTRVRVTSNYTLTIRDNTLTFLVDSDYTNSVIRARDLTSPPDILIILWEPSGPQWEKILLFHFSVGTPTMLQLNIHSCFWTSSNNQLRRDLMNTLAISILSTAEGLKIVKTNTIMTQMVNFTILY